MKSRLFLATFWAAVDGIALTFAFRLSPIEGGALGFALGVAFVQGLSK